MTEQVAYVQKKTDKKDSKWIADLYRHDLVKTSFIPPKDIRECREIARYRAKLVGMRSSEKNRYQDCMTTSNIGLASVLSNPLWDTAKAIMGQITGPGGFDEEACLKLIKGRVRGKAGRIIDSVRDCDIRPDQRFKIEQSMAHMDHLDHMIAKCGSSCVLSPCASPAISACLSLWQAAQGGLHSFRSDTGYWCVTKSLGSCFGC